MPSAEEVVTVLLVDLGGGPTGQAVALALAQDPAPPPDKGPEFGEASPVGLVVILLLGIATMFLIRSMTKRLRRLPASFDRPPGSAGETPPRDPTEDGDGHTSDVEASPDRPDR